MLIFGYRLQRIEASCNGTATAWRRYRVYIFLLGYCNLHHTWKSVYVSTCLN